MRKLLATLITGTALFSLADVALAEKSQTPYQRQIHQQKRIYQGVKSGELTKHEAKDLEKDQRAIQKEKHQFKSDGKFTKEERQEIRQDQNAASKEIYQEKHDAQERPKAD